jgi:hypothetical protein
VLAAPGPTVFTILKWHPVFCWISSNMANAAVLSSTARISEAMLLIAPNITQDHMKNVESASDMCIEKGWVVKEVKKDGCNLTLDVTPLQL